MSTADEIAKLVALRDAGELTQQQFEAEKAKLLTASPSGPPQAAPRPTASGGRPQASRRGCLTGIVVVIGVIIIIAIVSALASNGKSADIKAKATSVVALNGNTVRIYMDFTNVGKTSGGSSTCIINTTVYDQFGDEVNVETNETGTNHNIAPGGHELLYQDIGVNNGDAQYVKPSDVSITDC